MFKIVKMRQDYFFPVLGTLEKVTEILNNIHQIIKLETNLLSTVKGEVVKILPGQSVP